MLDVHPPHQAAHTWKDFFIHIATITVGLLIAVGLEQTVEFFHHRHERQALIEDMHAEAGHSLTIMDADLKSHRLEMRLLESLRETVSKARPSGGVLTVAVPAYPTDIMPARIPPRSVWSIAKTNGTAALVPKNLAEIYTRLDFDGDQFLVIQHRLDEARDTMSALAIRLQINPGASLQLSQADATELLAAVSMLEVRMQSEDGYMAVWAGAADAVVHNVQSRDEMDAFMLRHVTALSN